MTRIGWLVAVASALVAAGCSSLPGGTVSTTGLVRCPAWSPGAGHSYVYDQAFGDFRQDNSGSDSFPVAPSAMQVQVDNETKPIDLFDLDFGLFTKTVEGHPAGVTATDSRVSLRFYRNDTGEALVAYDLSRGTPGVQNPGQYEWVFGPGTTDALLLQVRLSAPPGPPHPTPLMIRYAYTPDVDHDPNTPSSARMSFTATFEYRIC